jgi:PIN domain nuclease of toxin-antitoxin system
MRVLLDTHALLWFINGDTRLSDAARKVIDDDSVEIYLSLASVWEISIKYGLGDLKLTGKPQECLPSLLSDAGVHLLPITFDHVTAIADLPQHHRDPFDRLILVQSQLENLTLVSGDTAFDPYGIKRHW